MDFWAFQDAAYSGGEQWRLDLIDYLKENRNLAMVRLGELKGLVPYSPEATYLYGLMPGHYLLITLIYTLRKMELVCPMAKILMHPDFCVLI